MWGSSNFSQAIAHPLIYILVLLYGNSSFLRNPGRAITTLAIMTNFVSSVIKGHVNWLSIVGLVTLAFHVIYSPSLLKFYQTLTRWQWCHSWLTRSRPCTIVDTPGGFQRYSTIGPTPCLQMSIINKQTLVQYGYNEGSKAKRVW